MGWGVWGGGGLIFSIYLYKNFKNIFFRTYWTDFNITWKKCFLGDPLPRLLPASVAQLDARPTGDQEVAGSTPAEVGNILSWSLIMKYFLRSFSPFR